MKTILDTCVWVAFFNEGDSQHEKALSYLPDFEGIIVIPEFLLVEIISVMHRLLGKKKAIQIQEILRDMDGVEILNWNGGQFSQGCDFFEVSLDEKCSLVDHFLLLLSSEYEVLTFDRHLKKLLVK